MWNGVTKLTKFSTDSFTVPFRKAPINCCKPSAPIWLLPRSRPTIFYGESESKKWKTLSKDEVYLVACQSINKTLTPLCSDVIAGEIEFSKCLMWNSEDASSGHAKRVSPSFLVQHWSDVSCLHLQFRSKLDRAWWVSVNKVQWASQRKECLRAFTALLWRASARYWAPTSPMSFHERPSSVSVCTRK